jgi:hypothetical protein
LKRSGEQRETAPSSRPQEVASRESVGSTGYSMAIGKMTISRDVTKPLGLDIMTPK